MNFVPLPLQGAFTIEPERFEDERGFFARTYCRKEFAKHGLNLDFVQCNFSFNMRKGTLRGMHYQKKPHEEAKLVHCTKGAIYDVVVDLRPESATFRQWVGVELSELDHRMIYVPEGFAHGFQTLEDNTEVFYQMSQYFKADSAAGVRWDDPHIGIGWPLTTDPILSERDASFKNLETDSGRHGT